MSGLVLLPRTLTAASMAICGSPSLLSATGIPQAPVQSTAMPVHSPLHANPPGCSSSAAEVVSHAEERLCDLSDIDNVMIANPPILFSIPRSVRLVVRLAFSRCLKDAAKHPEVLLHHFRVLAFWKFNLLHIRNTTKVTVPNSKSKEVQRRLSLWQSYTPSQVVADIRSHCIPANSTPPASAPAGGISQDLVRCLRLLLQGRLSDAAAALSSRGIAASSESTFNSLLAKHPQKPIPMRPPALDFKFTPSPSLVRRLINGFKKGSAPGPFGERPDFIRELLHGPDDISFLYAIRDFCGSLAVSSFPTSLSPFYSAASMIALSKADGGVRPIAVGGYWRRLCSKLLLASVKQDALAYLQPLQVGVGTSGGCEGIIHALNSLVSSCPREGFSILKTDFDNAFNSISREAFFNITRTHFPRIHNFVTWIYGDDNHMVLRDGQRFTSKCGVQQGDPLGPLLFALVLQEVLKSLKERFCGLHGIMFF